VTQGCGIRASGLSGLRGDGALKGRHDLREIARREMLDDRVRNRVNNEDERERHEVLDAQRDRAVENLAEPERP